MPSLRARPLFPLTVASSTQASPTQVDPHCHAPNFAYADLLELRELLHDVLLHRDTSECRNNQIFGQLSTFAKDGTSPFSVAFRHWERRYDEWKEASARTWGICRTPTKTDFLTSQTLDDSADDPTNLHPFYSCPTATADAQNIWTLPAAPEWWHDALWQLGEDVTAETWAPFRQADRRQIAGMNGKGICAGASFALRGNSSPSVVVLSRSSRLLPRSLLQTLSTPSLSSPRTSRSSGLRRYPCPL